MTDFDRLLTAAPLAEAPPDLYHGLTGLVEAGQRLSRAEVQVTFFGAFKAGKSTLLNAIIGSPLLPARTNRATGLVTYIRYGDTPAAYVTPIDCPPRPIFFDDVARYVLLDLSTTTATAHAGLHSVELHIPHPLLRPGLTLTDTPGLLDNKALTDRTLAELERTDLAVLVLAADKLVSEAENQAARHAQELLGGNIVFVVNRLGLIDPADRAEVLDWAGASFAGLGNELVGQPRLFATEARAALDSRQRNQSPAEPGLAEFEDWLAAFMASSTGRKAVRLARLGILQNRLTRLAAQAQSGLTQAALVLTQAQASLDQTAANRQAAQTQATTQARQRLAALDLAPLLAGFTTDAQAQVQTLLDTDPQWARRLRGSLDPALQAFCRRLREQAQAAILPMTDLSLPTFALTPARVQAALDQPPARPLSLNLPALGGWLDKNVLRPDSRQAVLDILDQTVARLHPILKEEAAVYLQKLDGLLADLPAARPPAPSDPPPALVAAHRYYLNLTGWCAQFAAALETERGQ